MDCYVSNLGRITSMQGIDLYQDYVWRESRNQSMQGIQNL